MSSPIDEAGNVRDPDFTHQLIGFDLEQLGFEGAPKSVEVLGALVDAVSRSGLALNGAEEFYRYEAAHNGLLSESRHLMDIISSEFDLVNFFNENAVYYFGEYVKNILLLNEDSYHNSVILALDELRKKTPSNFGHSLVLMGMCMFYFDKVPGDIKEEGVQYLREHKLNRMDLIAALLLHDIGKLHPSIVGCVESTENTQAVKNCSQNHAHPQFVHEVLQSYGLDSTSNPLIDKIATQHQEFNNGLGYPSGLRGGEINFFARIAHIWDVVEAISNNPISNRGYMKNVAMLIDHIWSNFIQHEGEKSKYDQVLVAEAGHLMHYIKRTIRRTKSRRSADGQAYKLSYRVASERFGKGLIFLPVHNQN